jgi:hypothetical protein
VAKFCVGEECLQLSNGNEIELKYYILKQEKFYPEFNQQHTIFGIEIEKKDNEFVESNFIEDITCDADEINLISCKLKQNKVLPIHLEDIVIDMLS